MDRLRFCLSSDQLELLLAFEEAQGLGQLAENMARDPSVVSRNLQRMAEDYPVLEKIKGRWQLTALGFRTNEMTRAYLQEHRGLLIQKTTKATGGSLFSGRSVLLVINAQKGLLGTSQSGRNNSEAEQNIEALLAAWRTKGRRVVHVQHVSEQPTSMFFRGSEGSGFMPSLAPCSGEEVVEKSKSSGFMGTALEKVLNTHEVDHLILTGFTANECIDATARDAAGLGFSSYVVSDATATFDLRDPSGKLLKAERVHQLTLANIHALYAKVVATSEILK